jgi:hypothetical protein
MSRIAEISQVWQNRREWPEADHHQNFEVLIRQRVSLLWKYCLGRVKGDLGFIDIEGDSLARGPFAVQHNAGAATRIWNDSNF